MSSIYVKTVTATYVLNIVVFYFQVHDHKIVLLQHRFYSKRCYNNKPRVIQHLYFYLLLTLIEE